MTRLVETPEQREVRDSVRRFLTKRCDSAAVRAHMSRPDAFDRALWSDLAAQLGIQALALDERFGGAGLGFSELCVVQAELGRVLAVTPFFASVGVAANAILDSGDEAAMAEYLPQIASGETIATLAVSDAAIDIELERVQLDARKTQAGWQLSGIKELVLEGATANLILVVARTSRGVTLFAVDAQARGVMRTALSMFDLTRRHARIQLDAAPARLIGSEGDAAATLAHTLDFAAIALAAEQVGGAERCLEIAVDYAKSRYQFGRPIGSYQAITHKCADMLIQVEQAKSALTYATAVAATQDRQELAIAASVAKAFCSEAYVAVAGDAIQVLGGIGFTWEHDAHLYLKRAKSSELMFGDPYFHRGRLASLLQL